jgi:large subunit ribosomal protein L16
MLAPKRAKFRKQQKGRIRGKAHSGVKVSFGEYGLLAETRGVVTSRQIEAARRAITHYTQRGGRLWIRIFPDKPITKKPAETRMGGGKGDVFEFVAQIKPGRMLFEMGGITKDIAFAALRLASYKLDVKTRIVIKSEYNI